MAHRGKGYNVNKSSDLHGIWALERGHHAFAHEEKAMRPTGIANSEQLGLLKQVFEAYCTARGVTGEQDRDNIASSILRLFNQGLAAPEEITAALTEIAAKEART
jgi:hypothetical protein